MRRLYQRILTILAIGLAVPAAAVHAETLGDALRMAYETNPVLIANRAGLRGADEGVAQARAARRPQFTLVSNYTESASRPDGGSWDYADRFMVQLNASLTVYDGGRSRIAIEAANEAVLAARAGLTNVEQSVLLDAAVAFLDVRRDLQFVALSRNNVSLLRQQLQAAEDRFAVGAITRTDVAVTQARLAAAQSILAARRGALAISQEAYRATVGADPVNLIAPPALPNLPTSKAAAEDAAIRLHPLLSAARHAEKSALLDLRRARAARLPSVSLDAGVDYSYTNSTNILAQTGGNTGASIGITGSVPIFTGGALASVVRRAGTMVELRMAETENARAAVRQQTGGAWFQLQIARSSIAANRLQIEAAQFALDGTRQEADLGARTLLDVLNAEQEVLDARSNLISAMHDEQVAGYSLLSAMGLLTMENLDLGVALYDPTENYERVQSAPLSTFGAGRVLDNIANRWE